MILVNFKGYGEWFIRDGNILKLAVVRTTKNPFEDPLEWKPPKPYGPYSDEYPYPDDDDEESFYENQQSFPERDREFDLDLRGIFARDPDVKGKIYDTNGLRCFGADYMICGKYPEFGHYPFRGVFRLTEEDEEDFRLANFDPKTDWDKFKDRIKILKPCLHPNSLFTKMVKDGKLAVDIEDRIHFEIQKKLYKNFYGAITLEEVPYILDYVETELNEQKPNFNDEKISLPNDKKLRSIDLNTVSEVVLGMAIHKYSYNPGDQKSKIYEDISKSLLLRHISVEIKEIEQCLKLGIRVFDHKKNSDLKFARQIEPDVEKDSLLKLLIGMAIDGYGYEPDKSGNSKVTGTGKGGIIYWISRHPKYPISKDKSSIKKYLEEAKRLLPLHIQ